MLSAGEDAYRVTYLRDARCNTSPINTASLAGGGTVVELLDPLHCKGELCLFIAGGDWHVFQETKEAWSAVATPIGQGADHIPTFERRHGHHGVDIDSRFVGKTLQGLRDMHKGYFGLVNRVKFVDGKDDGRHAQQLK